ncbi:MAG: hypothetical protein ACKO1M_09590 [Planctomycetota bacterium]
MSRCLSFVVPVVFAAAGCAHLATTATWDGGLPRTVLGQDGWSKAAGLPSRTELQAGQLVIHADFPLAGQHRLVRELEGMRAEVSQRLALPISDEPVHLYLFENPEQYEAFVAARFPSFPARRAFFVETDTTLSVFAAWQDRVAEDLRHETTHGYVHAVVPAVPLWLDEGIAEYFELPLSVQGRHEPHLAHLSGRLIEGTWRPDLDRMEALTAAGEMSQDHYAEAWCWVHWLLATRERRTILQDYLADLRRDPATPPLSVRLRRAGLGDVTAAVRSHVESLTPRTAG